MTPPAPAAVWTADRAAAADAELAQASAQEIAGWAIEAFGTSLAVACSMQDAILPHLFGRLLPGIDVLFLETGYHFAATLSTRDEVARRLPVTIVDVLPRATVAEQDAEHGPRLHDRDPNACCTLRKVEPLARALAGYRAWATGARRADTVDRAHLPTVGWDSRHGLVKVNPLAAWTDSDVEAYQVIHELPRHPLVAQGYPSIGCAPCTREVAPGADPRSGRWAGTGKTECGIHT